MSSIRSFTIPEVIFGHGLEESGCSSYWEITASFLGNSLCIPDLSTRRGLKRVHKRFEDIYEQLHHVYTSARQRRFPLVMAGIVGLMVKMNVDVILREKLFERGLLQMVFSLLEYDETRLLALQTLLGFTYYEGRSGRAISQELASQHAVLSSFINAYSDDPRAIEVAITVLAHAARSALDACEPYNGPTSHDILLHPTYASVLHALRNPANHRLSLLTHAFQLLISPIERFPEECQRVRSLPSLLVSFLRSKDIGTRALALVGIFNLSRAGMEPDRQNLQLGDLGNALRGTIPQPEVFADVPRREFLQSLSNSHAMNLYRASRVYLSAMTQAAHDHDFYTLGHTLSKLFQQPLLTVEGSWRQFEEEVGVPSSSASPFTLCSDTLPECARALREKGAPSDLAAADVIEMKFLIMRDRLAEAIVYATEVLERAPRMVFAYYVISLGTHIEDSLGAAKEGLRCPDVTPFLREHLRWRSIDLATRKALTALVRGEDTSNTEAAGCHERQALVRSTLQDAQVLIGEMADDTPLLLTVLGWCIILMVVGEGDSLSMNDLEPILHKISRTKELMQYFGFTIKKTNIYLAWNIIVDQLISRTDEWGTLVQVYNDLGGRIRHFEPHVYDGLATWFECKYTLGNGDDTLAQCSACGSPSAALIDCIGCSTAGYCGSKCQRSHWQDHQVECERSVQAGQRED
ncbi:hypothetical protein LXA43DRAFT_1103982 [Ganoderma leucocontextum]|nr:hypothetical protein LXA43DRAFT_1103982 [Ganoderma leucocontextum]